MRIGFCLASWSHLLREAPPLANRLPERSLLLLPLVFLVDRVMKTSCLSTSRPLQVLNFLSHLFTCLIILSYLVLSFFTSVTHVSIIGAPVV